MRNEIMLLELEESINNSKDFKQEEAKEEIPIEKICLFEKKEMPSRQANQTPTFLSMNSVD
jgi:hypothetical protein